FHTPGIPGGLAGSNLTICIDHFQRLPSLQAPLPMKIALRENRSLLALRPRRHTSHQRNRRDANRPRYPAPYESLYLAHDFSLPTSCLFLEPLAALILYGARPTLVPQELSATSLGEQV